MLHVIVFDLDLLGGPTSGRLSEHGDRLSLRGEVQLLHLGSDCGRHQRELSQQQRKRKGSDISTGGGMET